MKIAFTIADLGGCSYYRCLLPGTELQKRGHEVSFHRHTNSPDLATADVVIAQRISEPNLIPYFEALKRHNPNMRLLSEIDDNLHEMPPSNPCSVIYGNDKPSTKAFEAICRLADGMIVSTRDLAERYARFNPNITVAPNCIADTDFASFASEEILQGNKRLGQVRIGWAGSNTHRADLAMIVKPITRILREYPQARMCFFGDDFSGAFAPDVRDRIEYLPAAVYVDKGEQITTVQAARENLVRYYEHLNALDLDIALAPIETTTFNRCKSRIKLLEYGMCGVATIASRFGPYREYADNAGEIVTVANDPREWEPAIAKLIDDPSRRHQLATANRMHIGAKHLISHGVTAWEDALESPAAVAA